MYFLKTTRVVCPKINPMMLCAHIRDVNYAASYSIWRGVWHEHERSVGQKQRPCAFLSWGPAAKEMMRLLLD